MEESLEKSKNKPPEKLDDIQNETTMNDEVKREAEVISSLLERRVEPRKPLDWSHLGISEQDGYRNTEHSAHALIEAGDEMQ